MGKTRSELEDEAYYNDTAGTRTPIWRDAFAAEFYKKWANFTAKGLNENSGLMSYYNALACFWNGGRDAVADRQRLVYYFLRATGFSGNLPTDGINKHYASLPSSNNFVRRVIKNLCTNYINDPARELMLGKKPVADKKAIEIFSDITSQTGFNHKLLQAHRIAKLCGSVAVRPRIRRGTLQLQLLTPDKYQAVYDDYGNLLEMYIPFKAVVNKPGTNETVTEIRFDYWDKDVYRVLNDKGDPVPFIHSYQTFNPDTGDFTDSNQVELYELPHGYGRIPFEILSFDSNDNDNTGNPDDLWELVRMQLACNALDYMAMENVSFTAVAMWVMTNMGVGNNVKIAPGVAFVREGVKMPQEGSNLPPGLESVSMTTYFDSINDLKERIKIQTMKDLGLPNSLIADNPGLASGEAMKVDYRELEMMRKEDLDALKPFEKRLLNLTLAVASKDEASPYCGQIDYNFDYAVDYVEMFSREITKEQIDVLGMKKQSGTITPLGYLQALNADDTIETDAEAVEFMRKNIELFSQINGETNEQQAGIGATGSGAREQSPAAGTQGRDPEGNRTPPGGPGNGDRGAEKGNWPVEGIDKQKRKINNG